MHIQQRRGVEGGEPEEANGDADESRSLPGEDDVRRGMGREPGDQTIANGCVQRPGLADDGFLGVLIDQCEDSGGVQRVGQVGSNRFNEHRVKPQR